MDNTSQKIAGEIILSPNTVKIVTESIKSVPNYKKTISDAIKINTSEATEIIMGGAVILDASDIHVEPQKTNAKIRLRLDGTLQDVGEIDSRTYKALLSRVKLLAGLKLNINNRPQDGRFSILIKGNTPVEVRTSSIPAEYGESIVLRILNPKSLIGIEELGMRDDLLKIVEKEISRPNGMIIVTGPTGSGKTTTLYAILKKISQPEVKIITLEDPIEYHLDGISQTQVAPERGYDFSNGLRAILRQDPDVILVGEVRDLATATNSLQAALTGHLVLTTLHTNDAAGTIVRFQALGEKLADIAPAINMAIAQRLIRRVCPYCRIMATPTSDELVVIEKALANVPKTIAYLLPDTTIAHNKGCEECNFTGYKSRIGIFEAFLVDEDMERFILSGPSVSDLRRKAVENGMITMYQDGIIKVLKGETTIAEVEKVAEP
ncbi:MAG: GspE/PulE family protein [bacterium]